MCLSSQWQQLMERLGFHRESEAAQCLNDSSELDGGYDCRLTYLIPAAHVPEQELSPCSMKLYRIQRLSLYVLKCRCP